MGAPIACRQAHQKLPRTHTLRQHLQRHIPVEGRVTGTVDLAHAALADLGGDSVVAEGGAGFESHLVRGRVERRLPRYQRNPPPTVSLAKNPEVRSRHHLDLGSSGRRIVCAVGAGLVGERSATPYSDVSRLDLSDLDTRF